MADSAGKKARGALGTIFNQVNPLPGGKLGRTVMLMGTTALAGTAIASGLPAAGALAYNFGAATVQGVSTIAQAGWIVATETDWSVVTTAVGEAGNAIGSTPTSP